MVSQTPSIESGHTCFHVFPRTSGAEWGDFPIQPVGPLNCRRRLEPIRSSSCTIMTPALLPRGTVWTMENVTFIAQTEEKSRMMHTKTFDIPTVSVRE